MSKQRSWKRIWARKYAPYIGSSWMHIFELRPGFDICHNKLFLPEGNLHAIYFDYDEFKDISARVMHELMKSDIQVYALEYEKNFQEYEAWATGVANANFKNWTNEEMVSFIHECHRVSALSGDYQMRAFLVLEGPAKELEERLADAPNGGEILQWIATPYKHTKIAASRIEFLQMLSRGASKEEVLKYAAKYAWIPMYDFTDTPWTLEDIQKQILSISNPAGELESFENNYKEKLRQYNLYVHSITDPSLKKLVEIVHAFAYLKEMRDDYRRHAYFLLIPVWQEIAKRTGLTVIEANYLLPDELCDVILHGANRYEDKIKNRQEYFSLVLQNGKLSIFEDDVSGRYLENEDADKHNEVKGTSASSGIVRGEVSVIYHQGEFKNFKKGNILVTTMTHPEFISIMKDASAIVTDEGGITCHAAITARELGVPCIIGTKIGTQVFKDGDMVEVDAEKGIVKKLV